MEFHEVANIFPLLQGAEFDELVADIRANGLLDPITVHDGKIIDGRNRYRACVEAGVAPVFEAWKQGDLTLTAWIIAKNLHRRHLTSDQAAMVALDIIPYFEAEAKLRQGTRTDLINKEQIEIDNFVANQPQSSNEKTRDIAAQTVGTSGKKVQRAKKVNNKRPDLASKVRSGEITLTQAEREITKDEVKQQLQLPTDKYRVIYADPPWKYGNTMPDYFTEQADYYPCMNIEELCSMDIKSLCDDNAVLFIWVTSPILEDSFKVINAWGFKYKASFVWDKIGHNMGHYNSVRHEFLLICVKGSCQPDVQKLFDSVVSEQRTEHSKKPEIFRTIIDTIYPHGKRIELFAREQYDGWSNFGNQLS